MKLNDRTNISFQQKENIIEQTAKGEADIFRGLEKEHLYKNPLMMCLAYIWGFLYFIIGGIFFMIGAVSAIKTRPLTLIAICGIILILFLSFIFVGLYIKLTRRLITILLSKGKQYKIIVFPFILISLIFMLLLFYLVFQGIVSPQFHFIG